MPLTLGGSARKLRSAQQDVLKVRRASTTAVDTAIPQEQQQTVRLCRTFGCCGVEAGVKVIGHRGAAGLALENTIEALQAGIKAGVDGVEFDIHQTADGYFVLSHDPTIKRLSDYDLAIDQSTLQELRSAPLHNGKPVPTLLEALQAIGDTPAVVEAKGTNWAEDLAEFFKLYPTKNVRIISFHHDELAKFHTFMPEIPVYANERTNAIDAIQFAQAEGFAGVDLNYWLVNPLSYILAKRAKLEIIVYTVNQPWMVHFLYRLFPHITITTNWPDKMQFVRKHAYPKQQRHLKKA